MRSLVIVSVVLGVALAAPQGFPRDAPEVAAARAAFIAEYNRLAELAARAPDIHIYHDDPRKLEAIHQQALAQHAAFNDYSFSANLGNNQQFVPGPNTFPTANLAGHMAGHLAGHQVPAAPQPQPAVHRFSATEAPIAKWTGPVADTVPAGLGGRTQETDSVAAAKAAHFRAHAVALGHTARF